MENSCNFLEEMSNFVFVSKYARYIKELKRRETWEECVDRVANMHLDMFSHLDKDKLDEIKKAFDLVKAKKIVPSMRSMQFAGKAIMAQNARLFNCSVRHIDELRAFSEVFFLLLNGCGVGIGLSKYFISKLPNLITKNDMTGSVFHYTIQDSIEGWADSLEILIMCYFKNNPLSGRKIVFDYSKIRQEGAELKTSGGKAPGYKGLKNAHDKIINLLDFIIEEKKLRKIRTIDIYDILMHSSDAVLSGGIRRAACSVLFDYDDTYMMNAKTFFGVTKYKRFSLDEDDNLYHGIIQIGKKQHNVALQESEYKILKETKKISWIHIEPQRARSNNSVLLNRKNVTLNQFKEIIEKTKQFGEPGFAFVNDEKTLYNPCFEIGMIPVTNNEQCGVQFCNLSSINGAKIDNKNDFIEACKYASIIGTIQASYTSFPFLNNASTFLTEEESLLGVSITGFMDNPKILLNEDYLQEGAHKVITTNKKWAKYIGIKPASRTTCVKPEGTSSIVLESASGIHPHHAKKYFRRIQMNKFDNIYQFFNKTNSHACEESIWSANNTDSIVTFPIEVSDKAIIKSNINALEHLKIIKNVYENWVHPGTSNSNKKEITHSVSCTVLVKDNEWDNVIKYIFDNKECFSAVSLLSDIGDKIFKQSPMEEVKTEEDSKKWDELINNWKKIDYTLLEEEEDFTKPQETKACAGGKCDII